MTRRITGDQNNISSKLLGANLSDINIEKFRDITNYKKQKYSLEGKLTIPILKAITNKFSPAVMFTIVLTNQAISKIDALAECENVVVLNLSSNSIEDLGPLRKLTQLKIVDLADNEIKNVDAFLEMKELTNLKLEGNVIKNVDSLTPFQTCPKLKNLNLQALSGLEQNPICELTNYRENVLQHLPELYRLDGVPRSVQLYNGSELKVNQKKEITIELKSTGPFYCNKFPSVAPYTVPSFPGEAPFKKSLNDCKSSINELEIRLKAALTL